MNRKIFFDEYRKTLDPDKSISIQEVKDIDLFLSFYERDIEIYSVSQWAYVFATVYHETAASFHPVREAPKASEDWRKRNFRYYPYYGRGYVQITWKKNYDKYSKKLNVDLVNSPDKTMIPEVSWYILVDGFRTGIFTGKKISDYINNKEKDYRNARRCINGTDRMDLIANYAKEFERILLLAK
ncbi:glycoside hydrolase family 19 protein [Chryseobacterium bernardetii]|uniref:glycoside hydrolase family 19 protein n=1 Tax=Chryseobacterium bernardetii TaxID=1241978 RepID=UPI001628A8DA|nr:glycoside hydrolase family 19 protein [Chryseobacterium bernardetii]